MNSERRREFERKVLSGDTAAIRRYATEIRADQKATLPHVLSMLLEALEHSQGIARRIIIDTLPVVPEVEVALVRILDMGHTHRDPMDRFIQADIIQKLGKLATPTALTAIRTWTVGALAAGESHRHCVNVGLRSLAHAGDSSSLPIVHDCLTHSDAHIRSTAIYAVVELCRIAPLFPN